MTGVVVRQLVSGREALTYCSPDRPHELLILRVQPVDIGLELGLRRKLAAIRFQCPVFLPGVSRRTKGTEVIIRL